MTTDDEADWRHWLRRVGQTVRTFANWPSLLRDLVREKIGRGPDTLHFVTRTGMQFECPSQPGAHSPIYEVFGEDCYRLDWFLADLLRGPIHVLDVGGHIGTFACRVAQLHAQATIASFEASPTTASYLRRNVARNGFDNRITVSERAVAGSSGVARFTDNGGASAHNGLVIDVKDSAQTPSTTEVKTVSLDEILATSPHPVDFVKIDCEGGEYDLILGSSADSWARVGRVVLEFHPHPKYGWPDLRSWFDRMGMKVVAQEPTSPSRGAVWLSRTPL